MKRVVVLGAGFAGLETCAILSERFGTQIEVTLIDSAPGFVFGFSKLDVMFRGVDPGHVQHRYADIDMPGVTFVQADITAIDPHARRVQTSAGEFSGDIMVVALGASSRPDLTPGLVEGGYEFYTNEGAYRAAEALADFEGGKLVVGVAGTPFKCPPAPSETALLAHSMLSHRGLREQTDITLVMPFGRPIPPSPQASEVLMSAFEQAGVNWLPERIVRGVDPSRKVVLLNDDEEVPYDLFLCVPIHRAPKVVEASGMTRDGWIPVDPYTLRTEYPHVYAMGDVTSVGTPKAGVFSEGQARIAAAHIVAELSGQSTDDQYDGVGRCYIEVGENEIAQVDIVFPPGGSPSGELTGPAEQLLQAKSDFGSTRVQRWFGRQWVPVE